MLFTDGILNGATRKHSCLPTESQAKESKRQVWSRLWISLNNQTRTTVKSPRNVVSHPSFPSKCRLLIKSSPRFHAEQGRLISASRSRSSQIYTLHSRKKSCDMVQMHRGKLTCWWTTVISLKYNIPVKLGSRQHKALTLTARLKLKMNLKALKSMRTDPIQTAVLTVWYKKCPK